MRNDDKGQKKYTVYGVYAGVLFSTEILCSTVMWSTARSGLRVMHNVCSCEKRCEILPKFTGIYRYVLFSVQYLKGQSHEKVCEIKTLDVSFGLN
jgi:hypothetical protein